VTRESVEKMAKQRKSINVALAGVGNCASSLVQGTSYYATNRPIGLARPKIGGYEASDINYVAAFDIDDRKVGHSLSEAIYAEPNLSRKIIDLKKSSVTVQMAQPLDGASGIAGEKVQVSKAKPANIAKILQDSKADILVNLTPTGAIRASEMYAQMALESECAYINATPSKVATNRKWQTAYKRKHATLVGDDVMDQIGSTILHRNLLSFLNERGARVDETYQLDIGGGTESKSALDKKKYEIKRNIKTAAVAAVVPYSFPIVAGSSDFVDFMGNKRTSYFWIRGQYFSGANFNMDIRLTLEDGPACAGILTDVIRMVRLVQDNGLGPSNATDLISAYGFKAPPKRIPPEEVSEGIELFLGGHKKP
jgi:myo-inositol-1-phosphate synthase